MKTCYKCKKNVEITYRHGGHQYCSGCIKDVKKMVGVSGFCKSISESD